MKTRTIVLLAVSAAGALFVAVIVCCAGVAVFTFRNMDTTLAPTIDELFAAIDDDTFVETYDSYTSAEFKQAQSREQYEDLGRTIKTRLGALQSKKLRRFNIRQSNATTFADVVYSTQFEKGQGTFVGRFKKDGSRWLVVGFTVNSPEFQKDLATAKCPYCGEPHASSAKYCPKCGKPLNSEQGGVPTDGDKSGAG